MRKIYINGDFITLENNEIDGVVIENDKILKTGTKEEILKLASNDTEIINLNGKTMMPSFIDAHGHIFALAKQLLEVSVEDAKSIEDIKNKLADLITS